MMPIKREREAMVECKLCHRFIYESSKRTHDLVAHLINSPADKTNKVAPAAGLSTTSKSDDKLFLPATSYARSAEVPFKTSSFVRANRATGDGNNLNQTLGGGKYEKSFKNGLDVGGPSGKSLSRGRYFGQLVGLWALDDKKITVMEALYKILEEQWRIQDALKRIEHQGDKTRKLIEYCKLTILVAVVLSILYLVVYYC